MSENPSAATRATILSAEQGDRVFVEWLFAHTIDDLAARSADPNHADRYTLLGIAPLLRKLLLDGRPLIDAMTRYHRDVRPEFRITPYAPESNQHPGRSLLIGFAGEQLAADSTTMPLGRKQFLRVPVGEADSQTISVHDYIDYFSHVEGGVHTGIPKTTAEKALMKFTPSLLNHAGGVWAQKPIWALSLGYLAQVTVEATRELRSRVSIDS